MRIGIYGGTFSPPHAGHIRAAVQFLSVCDLDRLYILPTATPPHKEISPNDDPARRLAMCYLAFNGIDDRIVVSDYEQKRGGKSYTILTLEHFRLMSPDLVLLCGTDMFLTLDTWFRGEDILRTTAVCCLLRTNDTGDAEAVRRRAAYYRETFGTECYLPAFSPIDISSTALREMIARGLPTDGLLTPAVRDYIDEHGLYKNQ